MSILSQPLLDVTLPKMNGLSVCKHLRAEGYQCPILLLTAKASSNEHVMGLDAGANDYVVKPFDPPELLARVRALLGRDAATTSVLTWESEPQQFWQVLTATMP